MAGDGYSDVIEFSDRSEPLAPDHWFTPIAFTLLVVFHPVVVLSGYLIVYWPASALALVAFAIGMVMLKVFPMLLFGPTTDDDASLHLGSMALLGTEIALASGTVVLGIVLVFLVVLAVALYWLEHHDIGGLLMGGGFGVAVALLV